MHNKKKSGMLVLFGVLKYLFLALIVSSIVVSVAGGAFFLLFSRGLPQIITTEDYKPSIVTQILGKDGVVIGEFFTERRYVVSLEKIPAIVQSAFIAAEDDRFLDHQGIDLQSIFRAAIANFRAGRVVQGGSTITQQVAKSLLLTPERSFFRKIKEVILASRMERNLNKKQILYLYLNQIYLGQGAYGVQAASQVYFNKNVGDLTLAEAAILAGLPQAPSKYSPFNNPKAAKQRQLYVLRRLAESGVISRAQMEEAGQQAVAIYYPKDLNEKIAPYYVEHIRKYLLEKYGKEKLYTEGMVVQTPVDAGLSVVAQRALQTGIRTVDKRQGYRGPIKSLKSAKLTSEIEAALQEITEYNVLRHYPYKLLRPDGTHSHDVLAKVRGTEIAQKVFDNETLFQGLVLEVNDSKKEITVNLGVAKGVLAYDQFKWAQRVKEPSSEAVPALTVASASFSAGDIIWVRVLSNTPNKNNLLPLALEQIPVLQGALYSMDVQTGEVISMVGGYNFADSEFNRALQAERQPGSVFKPIIYSAALDKGYTPTTIIQDSPIVLDAGENEKWKPENFEEKFYGDTILRSALIRSRNIPTIKIVQDIQIPYLIDYAKRLGIPDRFNRDLSIALGTSSVSLANLAAVYAIFPRGGRRLAPVYMRKVADREGAVLEEWNAASGHAATPVVQGDANAAVSELGRVRLSKPVRVAGELQTERNAKGDVDSNERGLWIPDPADADRVLDPRTSFVMTHLMNEVATMGTGHEAKALGRTAAGKTGTTNDYLDAWFLGFTPQIVTGVWVGFDQAKTIAPKATGAQVALPIWLEYMKEAVKVHLPLEFQIPDGIVFSTIDPDTGKMVPSNLGGVREAFIRGTEPGAAADAYLLTPRQSQPEPTGASKLDTGLGSTPDAAPHKGTRTEAGAVPSPEQTAKQPTAPSSEDAPDADFYKQDL